MKVHYQITLLVSCSALQAGFAGKCSWCFDNLCANSKLMNFVIIMHPRRGPKGRGVAPIGAMRGVH